MTKGVIQNTTYVRQDLKIRKEDAMSSKNNKMVTFGCGRKAKVVATSTFFQHTFYHTKYGVVVEGLRHKSSHSSVEEAEEAVTQAIRQYNLYGSIVWSNTSNTLSPEVRWQRRHGWYRAVGHGEATSQLWRHLFGGEDGGCAVAVKVDSLGKRVDYLSLAEWAERGFELPLSGGDWHYLAYRL